MPRHSRRVGAHVEIGDEFAAVRFGRPDPRHEALVGMLVDLSPVCIVMGHPFVLAASSRRRRPHGRHAGVARLIKR
jgi:hypothetical protein